MNRKRLFVLGLAAAALLAGFQVIALGQGNEPSIANIAGGGSSVRWEISAPNGGGTLTITFPDGRALRKTFRAGTSPEVNLSDKQIEGLPDGVYSYELTLTPLVTPAQKEAVAKARAKDDDSESDRMMRRRPTVTTLRQSGAFSILNGALVLPGAIEERSNAKAAAKPAAQPSAASANTVSRLRNHRMSLAPMYDFVIADDLIVQGSACVGLDCVDGEVFGFDTIRVKENNTRIQFDDTSTSAGFPTNNWQIRANSTSSGGASFLAFVDQGATGNSETGTIVLEVDAGAPANSIKVSSTGKVGFRTATPVLDLHMNTSDTPAVRFEQNNSGGFSAQTWDVAGNEANFFVRDVTGGSRLPFRIRPGAPTSSIDISAAGFVGVGTASPTTTVGRVIHIDDSAGVQLHMTVSNTSGTATTDGSIITHFTDNNLYINNQEQGGTFFFNNGSERMRITSTGLVGIATAAPTDTLSVNGTASKPGGGTWAVFSDERLKDIKSPFTTGLKAVMQLQPLRYSYRKDNALGIKLDGDQIGFGAQAVQKVIPEAVTRNDNGYLMVNSDPIIWTMLNAIKEQQQQITKLENEVRRLKATSRRHRR